MVRSLIFVLPHLPDPRLTANARRSEHWSVQYQATKEAIQEAGWLAKIKWVQQRDVHPMIKARISYEIHLKDNRIHDVDGWITALKPIPDALIDVGVITYDDSKHLELRRLSTVYDGTEQTVVMVTEV